MNYDKDMIRKKYAETLSYIENHVQNSDVPTEIMEFYRLVILIYRGSFNAYFNAFGWSEIDVKTADQGKRFLFRKELSLFERDVIMLLNQKCREMETRNAHNNLKLLPARVGERLAP